MLGCQPALADDLTQETFVEVLRRPFEDRGEAAARSYLRKVAQNRFRMALRARRCRPNWESLEELEESWIHVARTDGSNAYVGALHECLDGLATGTREMLCLRYKDGVRGAEIAEILGLTEANVKTTMHRARTDLRDCIEGKLN